MDFRNWHDHCLDLSALVHEADQGDLIGAGQMNGLKKCGVAVGVLFMATIAPTQSEAVIFGVTSCFSFPGVQAGCDNIDASDPPANLFSFQENGTGFVDHGAITRGGTRIDVDALGMSASRNLFGYEIINDGASSRLLSIDTATAQATAVGSALAGRNVRGAAFDLQNQLWVVDSAANSILRVNHTTGAVVAGSEMTLTLGGGAIDIIDGTDIAVSSDGAIRLANYNAGSGKPEFFTVDLGTGALTLEFTDLVGEPDSPLSLFFSGITFSEDGAHNALYGYEANGFEDIYRYDLPTYTRTEIFQNIVPSFNAGRGDLAAFMQPVAVPEPGSLFVFALGLAGLGLARRKRAA